MSKIEYNSESREWYIASALILVIILICYLVLQRYVFADQSGISLDLTKAIKISFFILSLSGIFVGIQGYRFREGKGILIRKDGEEILFDLEKLFLEADLPVKETFCLATGGLGLWRPIGRLFLKEGEIEIKEIWFYMYFYRTQIALRGKLPQKLVDEFISNLD
jgi:hypothetical protein|tara:strand:- start:188 stop:679 length:492 start_codon:yes stop_codon:yes gene_type:complete